MAKTSPTPKEFRPIDGGQLFTSPSKEAVGAGNYVVKQNWRRLDNFEQVREGHDYFWINFIGDYANHPGFQPFPNLATSQVVESITYSAGVATVTFAAVHKFQVGEQIKVDGAAETGYNGEFVVASIGFKTLTYAPGTEPESSPASGSFTVQSNEPINLIAECIRPNGYTALVVGTKTHLFRFFPNDGDPYVEDGYWPDDYVDTITAGWLVIGSGYAPTGRRWESDVIDGYLVLNNGVDLICSYRVEEFQANPLYELRESGIASAGTMSAHNSILNIADIKEFKTGELEAFMRPLGIEEVENVEASQSGSTVTFSSPVAVAGDVGKWIVFDDGTRAEISALVDDQNVTVSTSATKPAQGYQLRIDGQQAGSYFSGDDSAKTASLVAATMVVTFSAAPATPGIVGDVVRFVNGLQSIITQVNSTTEYVLTLADEPDEDVTAQLFWIISADDYRVVSNTTIFTEAMVGLSVVFEDGSARRIMSYVSSTVVVVDSDVGVATQFFVVENPDAYSRVVDETILNRIHWRRAWGEIDDPTRWAAAIPAKATAGSRTIELMYQALSLSVGDEILILGAGADGGNVTANILSMSENLFLEIDQDIQTTATTLLSRSDATGGLTGFEDLQDDGSAILKMKPLRDTLVIYKDTTIFLSNYTGNSVFPYATQRVEIPPNTGLYFRNSLAVYENNWHVYAGRESFYRFNLTSRVPEIMVSLEGCRSLFYDNVGREQTHSIFAADNALTKETWFCFPGAEQHALILDQKFGVMSTTDRQYGAMSTVTYPTSDAVQDVADRVCLAAVGDRLLIYGKTNVGIPAWASAKEVFYIRDSYPFAHQKLTYSAKLESGFEDWGNADAEKDLIDFVLKLGSWSESSPIRVTLLGAVNPSDTADVMDVLYIDEPERYNSFPTLFRSFYLADRIELEVQLQKVSIVSRMYRAKMVNSMGITRVGGAF